MESFDLFDTLVAGRDPNRKAGDQDEHFPIAEIVAQVKSNSLIISDYYDTEKAWRILRKVAGLHNDMHVSQDDKATGKIWDILQNQGCVPTEHAGDDPITDYSSPKSRGVAARLTTIARPTKWEEHLRELGLSRLANIVREARLRTWHPDKEMRALQLFQIEANFPFLYVASLWFHRLLVEGGYARFLMSSRDCFLWKKIQDRIAGGKYEPIYWWTSRVTRYKPSAWYAAYCRSLLGAQTLVTDFCGFGRSLCALARAIERFGWGVRLLIGYEGEHGPNPCPYVVKGFVDESANFAKHPMILDVVDGQPVFWQDGLDWENNPFINAMHDAFEVCCRAMDAHGFDTPASLDLLPELLANFNAREDALRLLRDFRVDEAIRTAELLKDVAGVVI